MIIKNKLAHIIYLTIYVCLGFIGIICSLGYLDKSFNLDFYVYYTNLSNYICFGVMLAELIVSIKNFNSSERPLSVAPKFKFTCVILIMVTFLVYNFLLTGGMTFGDYILSLSNMLMHLTLPILFILDWFLFYTHGKTRWYYPLLCTIMPLIYVAIIMIRALILTGKTTGVLYPYFFLNLPELGVVNFILWILGLLIFFIAIGYLLVLLDNIGNSKNKKLEKSANK